MKIKHIIGIGILTLLVACDPNKNKGSEGETDLLTYATACRVFDFIQGPSQHCNLVPLWNPGMDHAAMMSTAQAALLNGDLVSLGGFGGYIVLGFDKPVKNVADSCDFIVLGNAMPGSSEPGAIEVSEDANNNGLPDDPWYSIKGSAHNLASTIANYQVTYFRPNSVKGRVLWRDNLGKSDSLTHIGDTQSLFPLYLTVDSLVLSGIRLPNNGMNTGNDQAPLWVLTPYDFGYADNQTNNNPKAHIDIEWAVNSQGQTVHLSRIHFVRIQTAVFQTCGWLGETTTEIAGVRALRAD